jgi:Mg2+-importing ATPase
MGVAESSKRVRDREPARPLGLIATAPPWWVEPLSTVCATGLTTLEAEARLRELGANSPQRVAGEPLVRQLWRRLRNPLLLTLLTASAISAATGGMTNFIIIVFMVVLSVALDFAQEHRATRAAAKLRASLALRAKILRDGKQIDRPVDAVVPGDVVLLCAGDRVPADARVLQARDFFVDQGLLTGESYPVEKAAADLPADAREIQQATNAVFTGSSVVSGSARVAVIATGLSSELGKVARQIQMDPPPTAFEVAIHRFGMMIMRITLFLVLFVILVNVGLHRPLLDSFLFAIALAVGLTPELLPMVISVTLSRGAIRMAKRRVIVKRLGAIQNLGSMDVLCTDKTGTLTEAKISLEKCIDGAGVESARVLLLAHLNSAFESGLKSPLDEAILARPLELEGWQKLDEVPFDFERRRVSVLLSHGPARCLVVKGAPDDILALCNRYEHDDGKVLLPLDDRARGVLRERCHALEREGLRVLGIGSRDVPQDLEHAGVSDERELVFAGFAAFIDPPKRGAREAIAAMARSGVAVKIVTGDSDLVAAHLASLLHLKVQGVLTGAEMTGMDEAALRARVDRTTLFCRLNPGQKSRIIFALRARGHVVGYLGDGINDAPPLHAADVGISVDSAVDVAREVADMIMLDHSLAALHEGVLEGRRTYGNITKYIMMGTSSNLGNMVSMAAASLFLPFLPMLPTQILLNNVLYDLSEAAIPLDRVDSRDLKRPRTLDMGFVQRYMWTFGLISSAFDALTFWLLLVVLQADETLFRTGWFVESLVTQVLVIFVIRTRGAAWASRPSGALAAASLGVGAVALLLPFSPLATLFHLRPPPAIFYAWLASMVMGYLVIVELAKRVFYRLPPNIDRKQTASNRQP